MNREQWLTDLATSAIPAISAILEYSDEEPSVKLSCGFPAKQGKRKPISAQLVPPTASDDFNAEIFVSPTISDRAEVIESVLPLLVAVVTGDFKQGQNWRNAVNRALSDSSLEERLNATLPDYPHSALSLPENRKQTTRLIKASCDPCAYIVRVSRSTLDRLGAPLCPSCLNRMTENN